MTYTAQQLAALVAENTARAVRDELRALRVELLEELSSNRLGEWITREGMRRPLRALAALVA